MKLGLIGHPVKHSLSPAMHMAALSHYGIDGEYRLYDVMPEEVADFLQEAQERGLRGLNVTIPHKQSVIPLLPSCSPEALSIGAVNTISFDSQIGSAVGHNTDVYGLRTDLGNFLASESLRPKGRLEDTSVFIIGTGGAARASVSTLSSFGVRRIVVAGRSREKAEKFVAACLRDDSVEFESIDYENLGRESGSLSLDLSLVLNATPVGQGSNEIPDWYLKFFDELPKSCLFYDLVYAPPGAETPLVQLCKERGLGGRDGLGMLLHQAARAFEIWTELPAPVEVMMAALESS